MELTLKNDKFIKTDFWATNIKSGNRWTPEEDVSPSTAQIVVVFLTAYQC